LRNFDGAIMADGFNTRLASFKNVSIREDLKVAYAEAGFSYVGYSNIFVECFHCGVQLKSSDDSTYPWYIDEENPWWVHAHKNSDCEYLLLKKGKSFVQYVEIYHNGAQPLE
jgi:Inhibitor of Apoptosis domain